MSVKKVIFLSFNDIQIINGGVSFIIDHNALEPTIAVTFFCIYELFNIINRKKKQHTVNSIKFYKNSTRT